MKTGTSAGDLALVDARPACERERERHDAAPRSASPRSRLRIRIELDLFAVAQHVLATVRQCVEDARP